MGSNFLAFLSRLHPFPKALGVSSSRIRHARRLALYILHNADPRHPSDSVEVAELCPKREHGLAGPSFRFLSTISFPAAPGAHTILEQHAYRMHFSSVDPTGLGLYVGNMEQRVRSRSREDDSARSQHYTLP